MQTTEVISVNLWQILISLCNLLLLFLLLKKFLYSPVKKMLENRQNEIDSKYSAADEAQAEADANKKEWEYKLNGAAVEADSIISSATQKAELRQKHILEDAETQAGEIIERAKGQAELEFKKAQAKIKDEIIDVSSALTKKVIEREISKEDHEKLFSSLLDDIGGNDDGNE